MIDRLTGVTRKSATRPLILIVDDDVRSASLLGRLLRDDGYDSEVSNDGGAALARLGLTPIPDALITDFHLAHADGLAVARYARSRRETMPIFIVTGDPHSVAARDPLADPTQLIVKPLDYPDLVRRLHAALC